MKKSANGNMYEIAAREAGELFAAHLSGSTLPLACVISEQPLSDQARGALASSMRRLGYGDACAFVTLEGTDARLDASSLFPLIEGLDPVCLVAADDAAAQLLSQAYRAPVPDNQASRLLGRTCIAFASFEGMLETPQKKQIAWALLKKLGRQE